MTPTGHPCPLRRRGCGWLVTATQHLAKMSPNSDMAAERVSLKSVSQDAQRTRWCLSLLRSRSSDINQSPWSKVRRPGRASCGKRSDRVTLMPFPSEEQFLEKIKFTDNPHWDATPGAGDSEGDSKCTAGAGSWTRW